MKDYHDLKFHRLPIPIYPLVIYFVLSKKKKKYLIKDRTEENKNLFTFVTLRVLILPWNKRAIFAKN